MTTGRGRGRNETRLASVTPFWPILFIEFKTSYLAAPMARTKQTARRSTKSSKNVELLEENQKLLGIVSELELEIEEMKKRCNCGSLSNSKSKRLKKIKGVINELELLKEELM